MTFWKRIRKAAEVRLAQWSFAVVPRLPRSWIVRLARLGGYAAYGCAPGLRRIGFANLDLAFGDGCPPREKRRILLAAFRSFALVMLDVIWFTRNTARRVQDWVSFDNVPPDALAPGPAICVTAHLGNWELLGQSMAIRGNPLVSVAAPLANPGVERLFLEVREMMGQEIVFREGAVRPLLKALRQGGKVGLLLDQNTKPGEGGVFVDLFGVPVTVSTAAAALAVRTGAPIFLGFCEPEPDGHYTITAHSAPLRPPAQAPDAQATLAKLTQELTLVIEEAIRRKPTAWLWMYKRWKYFPAGSDGTRHPFYARALRAEEMR